MVLMAETPSERPYRGVEASRRLAERRGRLLAAGLDLLGADQEDASAVAGVGCRHHSIFDNLHLQIHS